jgi:hypothetical protein
MLVVFISSSDASLQNEDGSHLAIITTMQVVFKLILQRTGLFGAGAPVWQMKTSNLNEISHLRKLNHEIIGQPSGGAQLHRQRGASLRHINPHRLLARGGCVSVNG